ncbi:fluoride efflux transporter CrcB [Streptomyces sp. SAJ15]|uniref:fluoride efflux transporter CrcB n=1 Tax=Streptomyces sp. SAJ15 TaxID=2011095 RepID=UPI001184A2C0|nr:fluoride efflux transporter CrcB [Streptomyces sp. SAJ15]TVL91728.1 chromosome condensation protein CrcB [Streptomyces sp. SAJ15]
MATAQSPIVAAVAVGGGIGAAARYAAGLTWSTPRDGFPWTTFAINTLGCAAIGVLLVLITEARPAHPLVRPFLGTGVLGGFTTFSSYAVEIRGLLEHGRALTAAAYLLATLAAALTAVWLAATATRRLTVDRWRYRHPAVEEVPEHEVVR